MEGKNQLTVLEFLNSSRNKLESKGIDESRIIAELLLCDVIGCDRMKLYLDFERPLSKDELETLNSLLERKLNDEPLQFIQEKAYFYGYEFYVDRNVLIPRPETENLVELILGHILASQKKSIEILEVGTGSGNIPIAMAKELDKHKISYIINSIDVSKEAIEVAKQNQIKHGPYNGVLNFHCKSIFDIPALKKNVDYIVSNPPYVSADRYEKLSPDVKEFEPEVSLTDGFDGLTFFRKLTDLIKPESVKCELFSEIGYGQKESINQILLDGGITNVRFINDYADIPRIVHVSK
ncbi:MAG: peptide chain release factor N(5)-glutamine methyltransferase [Ignavibacteria bacterium]|nr:peptide chain release factor N(5)-glutamine methyltransferase [Ignavibacteria bacterium]MBK9227641.1 peptide chain release factor N(5)-glutamine methyltransferase [Ignavibacteria bacterium]